MILRFDRDFCLMGILAFMIFTAIICSGCTSAGSNSLNQSEAVQNVSTSSTTATIAGDSSDPQVKSPVPLLNASLLSIDSLDKLDKKTPNKWRKFLVLTIWMNNPDMAQRFNYSDNSFVLIDKKNVKNDTAITSRFVDGLDWPLNSGSLKPKTDETGQIVFDVPEESYHFALNILDEHKKIVTTIDPIDRPVPVVVPSTYTEKPTTNVQSSPDPLISDITIYKNYLDYPIPNCMMKDAFPEIANSPSFNTDHHPKVVGISRQRIDEYLRGWTEGNSAASKTITLNRCEGVPANPFWNFIRISGRFIPRNARPADYEVTLVVKSGLRTLGTIVTTESMTLEQPISFETFVPIRADLQNEVTSVEVQFKRLST